MDWKRPWPAMSKTCRARRNASARNSPRSLNADCRISTSKHQTVEVLKSRQVVSEFLPGQDSFKRQHVVVFQAKIIRQVHGDNPVRMPPHKSSASPQIWA